MTLFWLLLAVAVGMTVAMDVSPGAAIYHYGWYNALDAAALIVALMQLRSLRRAHPQRSAGFTAAAFGGAIAVFAGVASGLMGFDTHVVSGVPGATVRDDEAGGSFVFPLPQTQDVNPRGLTVGFEHGGSVSDVGAIRRYTTGAILWQTAQTVVYVEAADASGNHLTITQPTNASFLSPVLLMQQQTTIAGMNVRFDTFSVPALRRSIKAVLFTADQAAQLRVDPPIAGPAILFAVSDDAGRVLPHGIGLVSSGERKTIAGLQLRAEAGTYPAVAVASAPYLPVLALGLIVFCFGAVRALTSPSR